MTSLQFTATVVVFAVAIVAAVLYRTWKKYKDDLVELKCTFCISENTDELLDEHQRQTGVAIDGILGNDFMVEHDYIIDYESLMVRHKTVKIDIKTAMDILELPCIVLYQGLRKYVFMLDTGATASLIHSKHLHDGLKYKEIEDADAQIYGFGGNGKSNKVISTSLYYGTKRQPKEAV